MIDSYNFGSLTVDGKTYHQDVIIFPDHIQDSWWRREGHSLVPEDLTTVIAAKPRVLLLGTGASGRVDVPAATREFVKGKGIELRAVKTEEACRLYNELEDKREVVVALHLTC